MVSLFLDHSFNTFHNSFHGCHHSLLSFLRHVSGHTPGPLPRRQPQQHIVRRFTQRDVLNQQRQPSRSREHAQAKLYLASLVRLLLKKGSIAQDELEAMVDAIDAEDGKTDGMYHGDIV